MEKTINAVGIIGAGTQGAQIAFRCVINNKEVYLYDISSEMLKKTEKKVQEWLESYINNGRIAEKDAKKSVSRLHYCNALEGNLTKVDLVIECVPENLELKKKIWKGIDAVISDATLLATNSSSIKSSRINVVTNRKDRTFNLNFASPVVDDLVEVMWNNDTADYVKASVKQFLSSLGCIVIETKKEIQGFSVNRVWRAIKKECLNLWGNGYCDFEDIDRGWMLVHGTPIGPFGKMDRVGLDIIRDIEFSYYEESGNEADRPPKALLDLCEKGCLGIKSGEGFYKYPDPAFKDPDWLHKKK